MKTIRITLLIAVILIGTNCKKYDEGPVISLKTKKARLTGEWELQKATRNGLEVELFQTNTFSESIECSMNDTLNNEFIWEYNITTKTGLKWTIGKDKSIDIFEVLIIDNLDSYEVTDCENGIVSSSISENDLSRADRRSWQLSEDKVNIEILLDEEIVQEYRIIRLKNDELKVELLEDGPVKTFEFVKL